MIRGREWVVGSTAAVTLLTGVVGAATMPTAHDSFARLTTAEQPDPAVTTPLPEPSATLPLPTAVPSLPPVPTAAPSLPVPLPTQLVPSALPSLPIQLPSLAPQRECDQEEGATPWPGASRTLKLSDPGRDNDFLGISDGRLWRQSISRDGKYTVRLIGTPIGGGAARTLDAGSTLDGSPQLSGGYFYTATSAGIRRLAVDGSSDDVFATRFSDGSPASLTQLSLGHGRALAASYNTQTKAFEVLSFDLASMAQQWVTPLSNSDASDSISPAVATNGSDVYVVETLGDGIHRSGFRLWRLGMDGTQQAQGDLPAYSTENWVPGLVVTSTGPVIDEGFDGHPTVTHFLSVNRALQATAAWTAPGAVEQFQLLGDELWTNAIVCSNTFMLTRRDPTTREILERQVLEGQSYSAYPSDGLVWTLETKNPLEPVAWTGIPLH